MTNILAMDDNEFLNNVDALAAEAQEQVAKTEDQPKQEEVQNEPEPVQKTENEDGADASAGKVEGEAGKVEEPVSAGAETGDEAGKDEPAKVEGEAANADKKAPEPAKDGKGTIVTEVGKEAPKDKAAPTNGEKKPTEKPTDQAAPAINYEDAYKALMAPIKANGKTIELKTPEEAVRLMQLGANYGKRMQELAPARKAVAMLENSGLLGNEDALSLAIDLHNGNLEALKKLLKDKNIDPLDLDLSTAPAYAAGVHRVSDNEINFRTTVEDVMSRDGGQETIKIVDKTWDATSKEAAWSNPALLAGIQEARESGVYDLIVAERDRRLALGQIDPNKPFLESYVAIGSELEAQAKQQQGHNPTGQSANQGTAGQPQAEAQVIATRTAAPKTEDLNGDRARAAAPSRSTPSPAKAVVNPLAMSDDDFMKQFGQLQL